MLGKIVRKSKLGYISSDVEILGIKTFLESCLLNKLMTIDGQEYLKLNTVNSFFEYIVKLIICKYEYCIFIATLAYLWRR